MAEMKNLTRKAFRWTKWESQFWTACMTVPPGCSPFPKVKAWGRKWLCAVAMAVGWLVADQKNDDSIKKKRNRHPLSSARFELAIFCVSGRRINQLSHEDSHERLPHASVTTDPKDSYMTLWLASSLQRSLRNSFIHSWDVPGAHSMACNG